MGPVIIAPPPPAVQIPPPPAVVAACDRDPAGAACAAGALRTIDAARAREGLGPIILPRNWASLSVADQLLVLTDLERTARGLLPVLGVAPVLDGRVQAALARDGDPDTTAPGAWRAGQEGGGGAWIGGTGSVLLAWYVWMYYDGYGSQNLACRAPGDWGCWGHRDWILAHYRQMYLRGLQSYEASHPLALGASWAPPWPTTALALDGGANDHEVVLDILATRTLPPVTYTWPQAIAKGAGNPAAGWNPVAAAPSPSSAVPAPHPGAAAVASHPAPAVATTKPRPTGGGAAARKTPSAAAPGRLPLRRWLGSAAAAPWELAAMLVAAKRILGGGW